MYVCMYPVCMHISASYKQSVRARLQTIVCLYVSMYVCIMCVCMYTQITHRLSGCALKPWCVRMSACIYVCMYVSCMHACISKLQTVRWNTPSNNGVYVCLFGPCMYVRTSTWKHRFVCMYICMYVCILNVCIYVSNCNLIPFLLTDAHRDSSMETMVCMFVYMYVCTKMRFFGSFPFNGCPL